MAKTSAERQAAYRAKRAGKDSSERRLNTWVSARAFSSIERLARSYGVTRRAVIELLVCHEDGKLPRNITVKAENALKADNVVKAMKEKREKQPKPVADPKPSESFGTQFEFEL